MAISAYPRTAVQGSKAAANPQNGLSLMLLNPATNEYEAATSTTFGGGGGAGGATAANQTTQITAANTTNDLLLESVSGYSAAQLLGFTTNLLNNLNAKNQEGADSTAKLLYDIKQILTDISSNQINGSAMSMLVDTGGNIVAVTSNALQVKNV